MSGLERVRELEEELARLRAAEATTHALHRRAELALSDVQHRMRNLLALIRSIAARTSDHSRDISEFMAHFEGRLAAMARCQGVLLRGGTDTADLEELVREEFVAQLGAITSVRIAGPRIALPARVAEAFALAVHELVTNAVKFGSLGAPGSEIAVQWEITNAVLHFDWNETHGAPVSARSHRGFGAEFIEQGLPFQIGAATLFDVTPQAVRCRISCPLPAPGDDA